MIDLHSRPHLPHWVATSRRSRRSRMLQAPSVTASRICVSVIPLQRHTYMGIPPAGQDGDKVRRMRIIVKQLSMLFAFHQLPGINSTAATPIIELNISHPAALWSRQDRKSTRLNSSHVRISYAVFCLKKKKANLVNYRPARSAGTP